MSAARRYAISGRDHIGKTTICHAVTARLRAGGIDAQMVDEQSRRSVALAEGRRGVSTQLDLLARTVVVELEAARSTAVVVCDRSLVDILAYTDLLPGPDDDAEAAMCRAMDAFAEHYLATYDAIFLPSWRLEDPRGAVGGDPLRSPVHHLQGDLAAHIERRLEPYADQVVRLDDRTAAVDAVVAHILEALS